MSFQGASPEPGTECRSGSAVGGSGARSSVRKLEQCERDDHVSTAAVLKGAKGRKLARLELAHSLAVTSRTDRIDSGVRADGIRGVIVSYSVGVLRGGRTGSRVANEGGSPRAC